MWLPDGSFFLSCLVSLTTLFLLGSWGKVTTGDTTGPYRINPQYEHLWVRYLTQGYLSSALKVLWHLALLPEHLPDFICCGAGTKNHLLLRVMRAT